MDRKLLQYLSRQRLKEARSLFDSKNYNGAYYLAGYAIELALKSCISKKFNRRVIPDKNFVKECYQHDLKNLVKLADLETFRRTEESTNPAFAANWAVVKDWNETSRYAKWTQTQASDLIQSINSRNNGVLTWIRKYW